jgi:predicted nucleic acid-binding protein
MSSENWYWDTCIFVAFLNDNRPAYGVHIDHIEQFLDDCKRGECAIYTSTITIAEITTKHLVNSKYGSFGDFLNDFGGSIRQVIADPNVMILASAIRGLTYTKTGGNREMGTPDAIHLASALVLESNYGVQVNAFHTFDNGKSRGLEGRSVPLLSYEEWCGSCANDPIAKRVIALKRDRPEHPSPRLTFPAPTPAMPSSPIPGTTTTTAPLNPADEPQRDEPQQQKTEAVAEPPASAGDGKVVVQPDPSAAEAKPAAPDVVV